MVVERTAEPRCTTSMAEGTCHTSISDMPTHEVPHVIASRNLRSDPDPPRNGIEYADITCDLLVDTKNQGWFLLESISVLELADQLHRWVSASVDPTLPFEYHSIDVEEHAKLLWFRPWHGGWAVGSPWADAGPFLIESNALAVACDTFLAEIDGAVESRWGLPPRGSIASAMTDRSVSSSKGEGTPDAFGGEREVDMPHSEV